MVLAQGAHLPTYLYFSTYVYVCTILSNKTLELHILKNLGNKILEGWNRPTPLKFSLKESWHPTLISPSVWPTPPTLLLVLRKSDRMGVYLTSAPGGPRLLAARGRGGGGWGKALLGGWGGMGGGGGTNRTATWSCCLMVSERSNRIPFLFLLL